LTLSWIKKILGKVIDNEEHIEEEIVENQPVEKPMHEGRDVKQREIEARMAYHYPKGNFRFPVISDNDVASNEHIRRPRRGGREEEKPKQKQKQKQAPQLINKQTGWRENNQPEKKEARHTRPFQLTEIPSPIYGFQNRPRKKEEVELELKQLSPNGERSEDYLEIDGTNNNANSIYDYEAVKEESYQPIVTMEKEQLEENDNLNESTLNINYKAINQENDEASPINEEDSTPTYSSSTSHKEVTPIISIEGTEVGQCDNTDELINEEKVEPGKVETDQMEVDQTEIEKMSVAQDETKIEETQNTTVSKSTVEKPPEVSKPARSHLPFNVLMLKQDKRKMQNNARQSRMETRQQREKKVEEKLALQEENTVSPQPKETVKLDETETQGKEAAESYNQIAKAAKKKEGYAFPSMEILSPPVSKQMSNEWLEAQKQLLDETLLNFNVRASVVNVTQGPSVTRFEVQPEPGVKVNKVTNLTDDIKLSLAAKDIRMEAPIPGKHTIGIEVPNKESRPVCISEVISSPAFQEQTSPLTAALGLDISGAPIVTDLSKMPHGLIAGATGSGKSVCINSVLVSLLYKATPDELKLLLIDPKMVELAPYNRIPHLVSPVITDVKAATAALKWAVEEMERRYELFAHTGCRDIKRFNELAKRNNQHSDILPYLVIVIDELADLMMMSPADVEEAICRIAQKARACGIHLIIATQRPSVDVITGLIKANVPTRVAFSVSSQVDSRTIIDSGGAERLLGKGDMLFLENGSSKPVRLQGTFVSDDEIDDIIEFVRDQAEPNYLFQQDELIKKAQVTEEEDELFYEACEFVIDQGGASTSALQRRFRIGYNRAARLMGIMEAQGIISEQKGTKPRDVLISGDDLEAIQETSTIM
jgi:DNA segregation ATPase FtsK/SpoIIIE, S-DNA-T family